MRFPELPPYRHEKSRDREYDLGDHENFLGDVNDRGNHMEYDSKDSHTGPVYKPTQPNDKGVRVLRPVSPVHGSLRLPHVPFGT